MTRPHDLLAAVADGVDPGPFALVRREGADHLELFTGPVRVADRLADIPLPDGAPGPRTLALVPYRQIAERGFACVDDGAPLEYLADLRAPTGSPLAEALAALPDVPVRAPDAGFDIADDEYAATVGRVLRRRDRPRRGRQLRHPPHPAGHRRRGRRWWPRWPRCAGCCCASAARTGRSWCTPAPGPWSGPARNGTSASTTAW